MSGENFEGHVNVFLMCVCVCVIVIDIPFGISGWVGYRDN